MQSSSLSTYIGYITGPRGDQPLGVRVVEPPAGTRQHQRGSLYAVVEVIGDHPDRIPILDRLLSEVHRVYYSAKGSQSQVMVEAVQQTQQLLREINAHTPQYPMQLGVTCAALLGGKLLVASSGPAFALLRVSERVHMFPSEPNMSVGGYGNVPIEVYRQDVQADDAMFLGGGSWLRRVPTRTLAGIVAYTNVDNCTDAADELFDQAGQMQVPGLLIVLGAGASSEPPRPSGYGGYGSSGGGGYPSAPSGNSGQGGGGARPPAPRRPRFGGLPTALNTQPPARMPSGTPVAPFQPSSQPLPSQPLPSQPLPSQPLTSPPLPTQPPPQSSSPPTVPPTTSPPIRQPSGQGGGQPRSSPPAWEQPTEFLPPTASPGTPADVGTGRTFDTTMLPSHTLPPPTPEATTPTTPATAAHEHTVYESESDPAEAPQNEKALVDRSTSATTLEPQVDEMPRNRYPISPLEEESFGGDLPVEPGDEFDPIFPPSGGAENMEKPPRSPSWLTQWQAQAGARLAQARAAMGRLLPERSTPQSGTAWEDISEPLPVTSEKPSRQRFNELEAGTAAAPVREVRNKTVITPVEPEEDEDFDDVAGPGDAPALEVGPFAPPAPTRGARARLMLLIALVVVILVPVIVTAVNLGQGNSRRSEAEGLTARAEIVLLGAQSALDQGDKVTARERLTEAQDYLAQAIELDGTNETREGLIDTIELELQEVLQITPLYGLTDPLIVFPPDARPEHVLVMNEDIFVIDSGRQALLQYRYDPALGTVTDQLGQVLLSQGDEIGGVVVGTLVDLAWLPLIPGFEDRPSLLITDRNNNVFRYDQRVEGATLMPMADRSEWGSIGQVQTYNGRIYVADEASGSILRYDPGAYNATGIPWFSPETPVNLAGLISMEIDGDIWLQFSDGRILRYRDREQVPFSPENSIALAEEAVDMYVTRQTSAYIYLVDAGQDRILVYDKAGVYIGQLRAPEDGLMRGLSGLYIDEVGGTMYILTQSGLFAHPVLP